MDGRLSNGGALSRRTLLGAAGVLTLGGCATRRPDAPGQTPGTSAVNPPTPTEHPSPTTPPEEPTPRPPEPPTSPVPVLATRDEIVAEFGKREPKAFGILLPGVVSQGKRHVALTFDACGGGKLGNGYDAKLIKLLVKNELPATLFLNGRWIEANRRIADDLAANPLFELANHGLDHVPLTVRGQQAYGIVGTGSADAAYDELVRGQDALFDVTGERSPFFRPGTAWCDDVGVAIARRLGMSVIAFNVNVDAGASAPARTVAANLRGARNRSITLGHFNRPESQTAEGLQAAIPYLLDSGRRFVTLSEALR